MNKKGLLIDTSAFVLLAGAGLLARAIDLLDIASHDVRRLPALPHQLKRGQRFKKHYSEGTLSRAVILCERIASVQDVPDARTQEQLLGVPEIDDGEAILFALVAEKPFLYLASDDKRSMIALASDESVRAIRDRVAGRVMCLETIVELLVQHDGVEDVAARLNAVRDASTMLRVVFSQGAATSADTCREGLQSYLKDLERQVGTDFLYQPHAQ